MSKDSALKKYEFKRTLERIQSMQGRGTELISLYIPHDKQIHEVTSQLKQEYGQAANIKSKSTRTNVQSAIDSLLSRLKYYRSAPENGVVLLVGTVDAGGGKTTMVSTVIEPPEPITSYKYYCSSEFYLEPLLDMLREKKVYGLLVLDRREATIGLLRGRHIEVIKHTTSSVPGKQRKGGQSARRFQQLRLIAIDAYYKRVAESASSIFLQVPQDELCGVLIGGPSPTKEEFVEGEYLHHEIRKKIIGMFDTSYTDESGLYELVDNAQDALASVEQFAEKRIAQRFMKELVSDSGLTTYGEDEVRRALEMGAVDVLLLSENLRRARVVLSCPSCGYERKKTVSTRADGGADVEVGTCPSCGSTLVIKDEVDVVEELMAIADRMGTKVQFISTDYEEGEQLYNAFGGVAALLRYRVE
ncbi:MAG: peptide chain release factor aRF-1 [Methermicoccaceae archaeon]